MLYIEFKWINQENKVFDYFLSRVDLKLNFYMMYGNKFKKIVKRVLVLIVGENVEVNCVLNCIF